MRTWANAFVVATIVVSAQQRPALAIRFELLDLGDLPGGANYSDARTISNSQWIAGVTSSAESAQWRGYVWSPQDGMIDLGALPSATYSEGVGVNDFGHATGTAVRIDGTQVAIRWTPENGIEDLGFAGTGFAINNNGLIVGAGTRGHETPGQFAITWTEAGGVTYLPSLPNGLGNDAAWAVNNNGVAVGYSSAHASLWRMEDGQWQAKSLGSLVPGASTAYGINDMGDVVGHNANLSFIWSEELGIRDLGHLPGANKTEAYDINNRGHIVGYSGDRPFWMTACGMLDLVELTPVFAAIDGFQFRPVSINDDDQIVGYGKYPLSLGWTERAFLLSPVFDRGDVTRDGCVDIFDVARISTHWGESGPAGDANQDGVVDIFDVALVSAEWTGGNEAASVPEPRTLPLVVLAIAGVFVHNRVRRIALSDRP